VIPTLFVLLGVPALELRVVLGLFLGDLVEFP
jgi:hypothetical protein